MTTSDDAIVDNARDRANYALGEFNYVFSRLMAGVDESKVQPADKPVFERCRAFIDKHAGRQAVPDGEEPVEISADIGETQLTYKYLQGWEKMWNKEIQKVEDIVFALSLNPEKKHLIADIEEMLAHWKAMVGNAKTLLIHYFVPEDDQPAEEDTMTEKERKRAERKKRMAQFTGQE